jgi:nicotinate-nucleotide adenylyltransferase
VVLGGSFDPIHYGHIAIGKHFAALLAADQLRIVPAGNPWQKGHLQAEASDRVAMISCAFDTESIPVIIDQQEIQRHTATYTIDTLRALRAEFGPEASIAFVLGADQLQHLETWHEWQILFDYAHICAASRPGFDLNRDGVPQQVADEFTRRSGTAEQIRHSAAGRTYLAQDLAMDISATAIRKALQDGKRPETLVPPAVLDYIELHHLYKN